MRIAFILICLLAAPALAGCFGDRGVSCENSSVYATSRSVPPVRVPDGLSVPDESEALTIPSGAPFEPPGEDEPGPCLEEPPDFFGEEEEA